MDRTLVFKTAPFAFALALISIVGCATGRAYPPVTNERLGGALAMVTAAEAEKSNGATAQSLRQSARAQYEEATTALSKGDNSRGTILLLQSEADAELSLSLAKHERAAAEAQEATAQLANYRKQTVPSVPAVPATPPPPPAVPLPSKL